MKELPLIPSTPRAAADDCCVAGTCATSNVPTMPATEPVVGELRTVTRVDGMDCASCALTLERVVTGVPGVQRAVVNFAAGRLDVHHDAHVGDDEITGAVRRAGFTVRPPATVARSAWWRTRRAAFLGAATLVSVVALIGSWGSEPTLGWQALFVAAIVLAGQPIFRAALLGVRTRNLDMNVLMATATVGAAVLGQWSEAVAIVLLFSLGNVLQVHAIERTRATVAALGELTPPTVRIVDGDATREVAVDAVAIGEHVLVRPGERVPLDGTVIDGASTVDEAPITGESTPVEKGPGDGVLSGSLNGNGAVTIRVEQVAASSTLQRIVQLVEQAQATKAPSELFVDRFSRLYTPIVVGTALLLMLVPGFITGDWDTWTYRGLALLIIACPCSLVISTPVTVVSGIGAASRRGILVKGGAALEAAGRMRALAIDKTGTLTEGRPTLVTTAPVAELDAERALAIAAALERRSEHPLAHAVVTAAASAPILAVDGFETFPGRGAAGTVDDVDYLIGSPRLFTERGIELEDAHRAQLAAFAERGETPVLLGTHQRLVAMFGLADTIRPDAAQAIAVVRAAGIRQITMLTGDSEGAARRVAQQLGIDHRAELLPEDKVAAVQELLATHGIVGMVGDGVNDAPALATASVSFAMGAAASGVALEAADIALMQDDLRKLGEAIELSRAAERILRQNIVASIVIKGAFVLLAPFGLVTLWLAVAADLGTSLGVTGNGLRLFRRTGDHASATSMRAN